MDWEYHSRGPVDPTSPFAQAAQGNGLRNGEVSRHCNRRGPMRLSITDPCPGFASPTKELGSSRPSSAFSSPSKNQQPRPPLFMPQQNVSGPPAPAFRNPAFTTPRKPFDHVVLSEASDLDDSPARTEASDLPNDTPEADRMSDVNMGGTITPAKIDKTFRYSRGASSRRHMPGRGEIRTHRDLGTHDAWRKKRHQDRDARHGRRQSEDSEDESDAGIGFADRGRHGTRPKADKGQDRRRGMIGSVFHMMEEHNTAPENLYRWMQLGINVFIGGLFCAVVFSVVHTIRSDINAVNEAARQEIRVKMAACQDEYMANGCANTDAPAFKKMCSEWYDCMMQNPDSIVRVRATMTEVANIMNDFFGTLNLKAWVSSSEQWLFVRIMLTKHPRGLSWPLSPSRC